MGQSQASVQAERLCLACRQSWSLNYGVPLRFCPKCGVRLEQECPACRKVIVTASPICPECQTRLQVCPSCFRLVTLPQVRCELCRAVPIAFRKSFPCLRGTPANTFTASPSLADEVEALAPKMPAFRQTFPPPLSMVVIAHGSLFFVGGEERLQLYAFVRGTTPEILDLGVWQGTSADEIHLWFDRFRLWVWSERYLSVVEVSRLVPHLPTPSPSRFPSNTRPLAVTHGWIWVERDESRLEAYSPEGVIGGRWNPGMEFHLPAPLKRFPVDRFQEAAFVVGSEGITFVDERDGVWSWTRGAQQLELLTEGEPVTLLPLWVKWRGQRELVLTTERDGYGALRCYNPQKSTWRTLPLQQPPSGSNAVVIGETLWLPHEGGQQWVGYDADGIALMSLTLPPNSRTVYAFAAGKRLWCLQQEGGVLRFFQLMPKLQEAAVWDTKDQPFVLGQAYSEIGFWVAILRRRGEMCVTAFQGS